MENKKESSIRNPKREKSDSDAYGYVFVRFPTTTINSKCSIVLLGYRVVETIILVGGWGK